MTEATQTAVRELIQVAPSSGEVVDVTTITDFAPVLPALTSQEDTFALAVIEYGGNLRNAYEAAFGVGASTPVARARQLIARPEIALRIKELTDVVAENALISLGSHLVELADIRDLSKAQGQMKVALDAEKQRGVVAGFYVGKEGANSKPTGNGTGNPMVVISINTAHDAAI